MTAVSDIVYRQGNESDIAGVIGLCRSVGWDDSPGGTTRNFHGFPQGFHVAMIGEELIGVCQGFKWSDNQGFVDILIVKEAYRKRGIGAELMKRCIQSLGDINISIYTEDNLIHYYQKFGFKTGSEPCKLDHYTLIPDKSGIEDTEESLNVDLKCISDIPIEKLIKYDSSINPGNRKSLLEEYKSKFPGVAVVDSNDQICGYGVLTKYDAIYTLSAVCADSPDVAKAIVRYLLRKLPDNTSVETFFYRDNPHAVKLNKLITKEVKKSESIYRLFSREDISNPIDKVYFIANVSECS